MVSWRVLEPVEGLVRVQQKKYLKRGHAVEHADVRTRREELVAVAPSTITCALSSKRA